MSCDKDKIELNDSVHTKPYARNSRENRWEMLYVEIDVDDNGSVVYYETAVMPVIAKEKK